MPKRISDLVRRKIRLDAPNLTYHKLFPMLIYPITNLTKIICIRKTDSSNYKFSFKKYIY